MISALKVSSKVLTWPRHLSRVKFKAPCIASRSSSFPLSSSSVSWLTSSNLSSPFAMASSTLASLASASAKASLDPGLTFLPCFAPCSSCICWDKMKPMTQGNLPKSFMGIRLAHDQIFDGRRRGSPSVHMLGQNEAYDTRKPPKKFQGSPTCAQPNLRWTTTWIAVGRGRSKINHPWVKFFSMQNLKCICSDKMIAMTQGSLARCFIAIRVGRLAVDHEDRRPSKIYESWVNFFLCKISREYVCENEAYDTGKPPNKFQGNPTCARPNLRWTTMWTTVAQ
ncbi:uncharacterized protein G2W53_027100 [Senna tora]|uniref:Uncharacterized protein n=1 Tax=Senna tora TaxID=362788 RepID=A0A834WFQ9_9FABA|nr:uncharacterized protein G2W53_027100 [Senna tora]